LMPASGFAMAHVLSAREIEIDDATISTRRRRTQRVRNVNITFACAPCSSLAEVFHLKRAYKFQEQQHRSNWGVTRHEARA